MCVEGVNKAGCMPYKDGCLITAQILVIPALALSFFTGNWFVGLALGLTAFLIPQIAWCCAMNKCGFITGGVFGVLATGVLVAFGVIIMLWIQIAEDACEAGLFDWQDCNTLTQCDSTSGGNPWYCDGCDCSDETNDSVFCIESYPDCSTLTYCDSTNFGLEWYCDGCDCTDYYGDNEVCQLPLPTCSDYTQCSDDTWGMYYCDGCTCAGYFDDLAFVVGCQDGQRRLTKESQRLTKESQRRLTSCLEDELDEKGYDVSFDTVKMWVILSFVGAALWFISSIFVFSFACCSRYDAAVEKLKEGGEASAPAEK